jgi:hypothetical protein
MHCVLGLVLADSARQWPILMVISDRLDQSPFHANDDGSATTGIAA